MARPPAEHGMPELVHDLAPDLESLADLVVADRDKERNRRSISMCVSC